MSIVFFDIELAVIGWLRSMNLGAAEKRLAAQEGDL